MPGCPWPGMTATAAASIGEGNSGQPVSAAWTASSAPPFSSASSTNKARPPHSLSWPEGRSVVVESWTRPGLASLGRALIRSAGAPPSAAPGPSKRHSPDQRPLCKDSPTAASSLCPSTLSPSESALPCLGRYVECVVGCEAKIVTQQCPGCASFHPSFETRRKRGMVRLVLGLLEELAAAAVRKMQGAPGGGFNWPPACTRLANPPNATTTSPPA